MHSMMSAMSVRECRGETGSRYACFTMVTATFISIEKDWSGRSGSESPAKI